MSETHARIATAHGEVVIRFFADKAPGHVKNFIDLAKRGFYDGKIFHRVIPNFMVQGGCASGTGTGAHPDGITLTAEFNDLEHTPGRVSMARKGSGPDTAGTQFFICHGKHSAFLDGQYTVFGEVVSGMEAVNAIAAAPTGERDRPLQPVAMTSVTIVEG
jgi:peptidyl-prolyl cis-trans isomerase B (cyclophilin B)